MAAGDFTNIRIESTSYESVTVRYTYGGSGDIALYRSTDGSSYSSVQSIPNAYGSYPTIIDVGLSSSTYYYYKFSDDGGSTFTSVYNVQTQKQFPVDSIEGESRTELPTFSKDDDVSAGNLELMRDQLESVLNNDVLKPQNVCDVCPENGALILDCSEGCHSFRVRQDDVADINSISMNCNTLDLIIEVPEGTSTEVCGWPQDSGFGGDECYQAPITSPLSTTVIRAEPNPCPFSRTRYTSAPCRTDYIYECWSKGSVAWASKRDLAVPDCDCASVANGYSNITGSAYTFTCLSGRQTKLNGGDHLPMAGFSLLFKKINTNCAGFPAAATVIDYTAGGFTTETLTWDVEGQPVFGFAINVPSTATIRDFTGHVLLIDYINSRYLWGRYTNHDLLSGVMPTVLGSIAFATITPTKINLIIDATAGNTYSAYDVVLENATQTETLAHSAISLNSEPTGAGPIWVANTNFGVHAASVKVRKETDLYWFA